MLGPLADAPDSVQILRQGHWTLAPSPRTCIPDRLASSFLPLTSDF